MFFVLGEVVGLGEVLVAFAVFFEVEDGSRDYILQLLPIAASTTMMIPTIKPTGAGPPAEAATAALDSSSLQLTLESLHAKPGSHAQVRAGEEGAAWARREQSR